MHDYTCTYGFLDRETKWNVIGNSTSRDADSGRECEISVSFGLIDISHHPSRVNILVLQCRQGTSDA